MLRNAAGAASAASASKSSIFQAPNKTVFRHLQDTLASRRAKQWPLSVAPTNVAQFGLSMACEHQVLKRVCSGVGKQLSRAGNVVSTVNFVQ
eukprot:scaffold223707_cov22-Tisochrysis_lutea.AAC.1